MARWIVGGPAEEGWTHDETFWGERCKKYPLLVTANPAKWRVHVQGDDIKWFREIETCKVKGKDSYLYEPVWIAPEDAEARGIKDGDICKVYNDRGTILCGARISERVAERSVVIAKGSRVDPIAPHLDRGGAANLICPGNQVSKHCKGFAVTGYLAEVAKVTDEEYEGWKRDYPEAFARDYDPAIGIDCVAMCVNDVICAGAKPLVFLDYIACGKNIPEKIAEIVKGVAEGCVQAGCSLVGGETAEHPGMMPEDEYDLAGFTVGVVDKAKILDNSTMQPGDVIIALPSTGVHSNGFSLVRKIFDIDNNPDVLKKTFDGMDKPLGEALLAPTKIYVKPVLAVMDEITVKGVSHITGGGFYENIPRSLKKGCAARIAKADVRTPALFDVMQREGGISEHDMFNTFNMGVGMVLTVAPEDADKAIAILKAHGEDAYRLGTIVEGDGVELV